MVLNLPIINRRSIAFKTNEVSFGISGDTFPFQAGQHIQVSVPKLLYPDPKGSSRTFSIASSPSNKKSISISFRDSGSGFKRTLMELPIGTKVAIEGPHGFFTLPRDHSRPVVFIAGGIGITPFLSMISFASEKKLTQRITLLYANRDKENAAYLDTLETLEKQNPYFIMKNKFGFLDNDFLKSAVEESPDVLWYIAGPQMMVATVKEALIHFGIDEEKVYLEEFIGY